MAFAILSRSALQSLFEMAVLLQTTAFPVGRRSKSGRLRQHPETHPTPPGSLRSRWRTQRFSRHRAVHSEANTTRVYMFSTKIGQPAKSLLFYKILNMVLWYTTQAETTRRALMPARVCPGESFGACCSRTPESIATVEVHLQSSRRRSFAAGHGQVDRVCPGKADTTRRAGLPARVCPG